MQVVSKKTKTNCLFCGKDMSVYFSQIKIGEGKYCSVKCHGLSKRTLNRDKKCIVCGTGIKYSSTYCLKHSQLGERAPNWKGGRTKAIKIIRNSAMLKSWRKLIFARDYWTCQMCKHHGGTLHAHHIMSFKDYEELRFDIDNGITLCPECHKNVHYGTERLYECCEDI